ncbi:hypothetical protein CAPTEDRAFT_150242 [Capitella teleta]|uniref:S-adenosylmethionine decarboxylase proenzyme n=1 Tax=Capitella teleta TaxID=283909 RepID=R7VF94_CAPTE|nr:hypothetical protein CAPTEDRAFT_150242 [Capitella teleta]|eukprot:ELU17284.1 hypothetical protein CAPTEDRAFT_150242 [Capitella teleta]
MDQHATTGGEEIADSTDCGHFFEGTEKLLEIWFARNNGGGNPGDLRSISREEWVTLLKLVHCEIISSKQDADMIAYLLSESSLFVSKRRIILKTCGRTTLLAALTPLLSLVKQKCGMQVMDIFYSRKNYMRPELQHELHQSFDDEVKVLDKLFDNGAAYALGRLNRDTWYLYTIETSGINEPDQTLELLMQDLDSTRMSAFTKAVCKDGLEATKKSGIDQIIPGAIIDDFLFEPCGYSMNAILPNGAYFTIHITPEPEFSYVSFETNVEMSTYEELILRVLDIFQPKKFLMTLFANPGSSANDFYSDIHNIGQIKGFSRHDHQLCVLKSYNLTCSVYKRSQQIEAPPI